jgi:hypothetical protein
LCVCFACFAVLLVTMFFFVIYVSGSQTVIYKSLQGKGGFLCIVYTYVGLDLLLLFVTFFVF